MFFFSACWTFCPVLRFFDQNRLLSTDSQKLVHSWAQFFHWIDTWEMYIVNPRLGIQGRKQPVLATNLQGLLSVEGDTCIWVRSTPCPCVEQKRSLHSQCFCMCLQKTKDWFLEKLPENWVTCNITAASWLLRRLLNKLIWKTKYCTCVHVGQRRKEPHYLEKRPFQWPNKKISSCEDITWQGLIKYFSLSERSFVNDLKRRIFLEQMAAPKSFFNIRSQKN